MLFRILESVVPPVARAIWRPIVVGRENVPSSGGVLLASNHLSFADSVVIPVVRAAQRGVPGQVRVLPGHRDQGRAPARLVRGARHAAGRPRRHPGRDRQPRTPRWRCSAGARRSASTPRAAARATAGSTAAAPASPTSRSPPACPSYPSGCKAPQALQPVGARYPKLAKVTVAFGEPIDFTGRFDGVPAGRARREVTDEIMTAIQRLTGQEQAGVYNDRGPHDEV